MNNESNLDSAALLQELIIPTSWGKRLVAYLLDVIFFYILIAILVGGLLIAAATLFDYDVETFDTFIETPIGSLLDKILTALCLSIYFILFELTIQRTPAKVLLRLRIVNEEGLPLSSKQIIQRNFSRLIPFEGVSYIAANPRGLHDKFSDSYVIDDSEFYQKLLKQVQHKEEEEEQ